MRPSEAEGQSSFFNILVIHQNRAEGRGRKNAIYESMIPEWMDGEFTQRLRGPVFACFAFYLFTLIYVRRHSFTILPFVSFCIYLTFCLVVVWGHEHECQTEFVESLHGRFRVLQPGSTVATSLVEGEAQPKHMVTRKGSQESLRGLTLDVCTRPSSNYASSNFGSRRKHPRLNLGSQFFFSFF